MWKPCGDCHMGKFELKCRQTISIPAIRIKSIFPFLFEKSITTLHSLSMLAELYHYFVSPDNKQFYQTPCKVIDLLQGELSTKTFKVVSL